MNSIELKHEAIRWLTSQSVAIKSRPYSFTPKQVAEAVGGSFTVLGGKNAEEIVNEMTLRGISIRYDNNTKPRQYVLLKE